jgi:hypothetical protein
MRINCRGANSSCYPVTALLSVRAIAVPVIFESVSWAENISMPSS